MKIGEYERDHFIRYQRFAEVVRNILGRAIASAEGLPRPQSIQARAKTPDSLRKRLEESGALDAQVDVVRRDLAGVRLIFYTNNDVERFINSSIVFDNFEVDLQGTKVHHPVPENGETRYQAIHYTVSLNATRLDLPEYREFATLRCEIQIQTILIHAWAETSHDIIYKVDNREGFGNQAFAQIKKRFERIMDKYLVPAGYEFQRVQQDYERLVAGKALFDQDLLVALKNAADNNERFDLINSLSYDLLPLYDDVPAVFPEILDALVEAVTAARETEVAPIETPFSNYEGHTYSEIIEKVVEIIDQYRYAAFEEAFIALQNIFAEEIDERARQKIIEVVGHISRYDLQAWAQVGPAVQIRLAEIVQAKENARPETRPLIIEMWTRLLDAEASGSRWSVDSVSLQHAEVPAADIRQLRDAAIEALFTLFETSIDDGERRRIFFALENAARTATRGGPSNEFLRQSILDHLRVMRFFTEKADGLSYELRETIEHAALFAHYRTLGLVGDRGSELGCRDEARQLDQAIFAMRDRFNEDATFRRYKILVGYEGVMPFQWEGSDYDPEEVEKYRDRQIAELLEDVSEGTAVDWLAFLERCAATKSNDMATFPKMGEFIVQLSKSRPAVAEYILESANADLLQFLPGFLNGLHASESQELYKRMLAVFMARGGSHLRSIAMHWKSAAPDDPATLAELVQISIAADQRTAVADCFVFVLQNYPNKVPDNDTIFRPALRHLIHTKTPGWVSLAFLPKRTPIFDDMAEEDAALLLESFMQLVKLGYETERLVGYVAHCHLGMVWDFLGNRFDNSQNLGDDETRYEAVPYSFQKLVPVLSSDVALAIEKVASWFEKDSRLFSFRGGKILAQVFPKCDAAFADTLVARIEAGELRDAKFALAVMQNFHGEVTTHNVLKTLLAKFPGDDGIEDGVERSIENTGVVHGEFGFVDGLRGKKALIESWLENENLAVVDFATRFIVKIDRRIISEQRRADTRRALHRLNYDNDDQDDDEAE